MRNNPIKKAQIDLDRVLNIYFLPLNPNMNRINKFYLYNKIQFATNPIHDSSKLSAPSSMAPGSG
jgi:hypothetical protein